MIGSRTSSNFDREKAQDGDGHEPSLKKQIKSIFCLFLEIYMILRHTKFNESIATPYR
jgi:hypothetical protein